jgi:protein N-terminal methyltransferase
MSTSIPKIIHPTPDVERGVKYWQGVPATVDGVLGGYGHGTLPIVDAQGSRTFLLQMLPRLSTLAPASASKGPEAWLKERIVERGGKGKSKSRALDCGAGVGRVSRDVLTRLCDIVHIVEPVESVSLLSA